MELMQYNVSLCNGDSVRPAGVVKNFNVDISRLLLGLGGPYLP